MVSIAIFIYYLIRGFIRGEFTMAKTEPKEEKGMQALKSKANAELKKAKAAFVKHEKSVKKYVKTHPAKAVALAAGLGVALGALATAAMKRRRK
jgi:ElaB/YqjD/DUF883 family membrane-anchored ribosome-binding protein